MSTHHVNLISLLPRPLQKELADYRWTAATDGASGSAVVRLQSPKGQAMYLKTGEGHVAEDIAAEAARLQWLRGRLGAPAVVHFTPADASHGGVALLLTHAVPGTPAFEVFVQQPEGRSQLIAALHDFLHAVHALPIDDCPFDASATARLAEARRRIDLGLVDVDDFDEDHAGWTAEAVWNEVTGLLPLPFERVFTHGDFSLDNVLMDSGRVSGCIDWGRAGVGDPYQDIAILWRELGEFGETLQGELLRRFETSARGSDRLRFHLGLDEFF